MAVAHGEAPNGVSDRPTTGQPEGSALGLLVPHTMLEGDRLDGPRYGFGASGLRPDRRRPSRRPCSGHGVEEEVTVYSFVFLALAFALTAVVAERLAGRVADRCNR